ncbi:MAG: DUF1858 domain-containing protein [candidate division KSB1 bacterium]|nr:DUF1858 domain-containing protein [candidate division KSB1 bacterium]
MSASRKSPPVGRQTTIEELVYRHPEIVPFLMEKGIRCLACGEPLWGTLESAARERGYSEAEIDALVAEIRDQLGDDEGAEKQ